MYKALLFFLALTSIHTTIAQFTAREDLFFPGSLPDPRMSDMDADGDQDLVIALRTEERLVWYANEGTGTFGSEMEIEADYPELGFIELVDLNGDELIDVFIATDGGVAFTDKMSWYENLGEGTFSSENVIIEDISNNDYDLADIDGDGDIDIVGSYNGSDVSLYLNDGAGVFASETILTGVDAANCDQVAIADYDNDGDLDIFGAGGTYLFLIENLGGGSFEDGLVLLDLVLDPRIYYDVEVADLTADGYPEVILYDIGYADVGYYDNPDGLSLGDYHSFGLGSGWDDADLAVSDWNHDGINDVLWSNLSAAGVTIVESTGPGTFADPTDLLLPEPMDLFVSSLHFDIADLDFDGSPDIIGDMAGDRISVYWNETPAPFSIGGNIYVDINENGVKDLDEGGALSIGVTRSPEFGLLSTNAAGNYSFGYAAPDGSEQTFTPGISELWGISTPYDSYTVTIDGDIDTLDFGIYPLEIVDSVDNELIGNFPRCNDTINYYITIKNNGTTITSGIIELELDDSITYISAEILPDSIVEQTVYWSYEDLDYLAETAINVQVLMPDFLSEGDLVTSYISSTIDGTAYSTTDSLVQEIVCAYDPNDKIATPAGIGEEGFIPDDTQYMEYTVRFQNTGSDTAFTVVIKD